MPLTKEGKKVMLNMVKEYGKKKGTSVFYASINKKKSGSSKWHKQSKGSYDGKAVAYAKAKMEG